MRTIETGCLPEMPSGRRRSRRARIPKGMRKAALVVFPVWARENPEAQRMKRLTEIRWRFPAALPLARKG
ncbi:hypothetical protein AA0312_1748 [Acetobacter tropicalis NRIC 0312]|uniref:Uncharacterized protein n=1 Tax=Acetobacter tropicalis TaxID=104102 RepID=A0A511FNY4_9PROT|nr:hypothetical protein ATR1_069c0054 [Acetobacter tropicalis]GBR70229.1 hypothetical protein AA0312_1748 [Acetobacter tropicalis NRIC 0312]GEL50663.1 hypothetical protein ATR01nite_17380 [Acetobacter tropicalis]